MGKIITRGVELCDDGTVMLIRCPKCDRENYCMNVTRGVCTWCGFDANKLVKNESE